MESTCRLLLETRHVGAGQAVGCSRRRRPLGPGGRVVCHSHLGGHGDSRAMERPPRQVCGHRFGRHRRFRAGAKWWKASNIAHAPAPYIPPATIGFEGKNGEAATYPAPKALPMPSTETAANCAGLNVADATHSSF